MTRRNRLAAWALLAAPVVLTAAGCYRVSNWPVCKDKSCASRPVGDLVLDRGDWLVSDEKGVWKVLEEQDPKKAPVHVGYLILRNYREMRGGPAFNVYDVTRLDRNDQIGTIDGLGNATRFLPKRNGGIETKKVGNSTLALNVTAIFDTIHAITLEATNERKLAFEALDMNHDGGLSKDEYPRISEPSSADKNHDGKIDYQEFDAIDQL